MGSRWSRGGVEDTIVCAVVCTPTATPPPYQLPIPSLSQSPHSQIFLSFHRPLFLLREFSLWILRKIITSGRWGEVPADTWIRPDPTGDPRHLRVAPTPHRTSEVITARKATVRVGAPGRTRAVSACTTRATRLARTRSVPCPSPHISASSAAPPAIEAGRDASSGRGGAMRCRRAGAWPRAVALRRKARTSCAGCACGWSCAATHDTAARGCWGRRATSTTLHRPWSTYATGTGPLRRPLALGRHESATDRSSRARERAAGMS